MSKVIVVGGGAAGMMAAVFAAENGHHVQIYEKNDRLGRYCPSIFNHIH